MVISGRLPITDHNIEIITQPEDISSKKIINQHSKNAALTIIGIREDLLKHQKQELFNGYDEIGSVLFVNSHDQKEIS